MGKEIIDYLKEKYLPRVIALAGSRGAGTNNDASDWDLFLFCENRYVGGFYNWNGQLLDLTFHTWPKPNDWIFTIPYGPVWPVKVLFDDTGREFGKVLERTKSTYELGPLKAYPTGCEERLQKLERWKGKIVQHKNEPEMQFYYAGYVYEFLVRIWFEQQNLWPKSPAQAFPYIKNVDYNFWKLLSDFASGEPAKRVEFFDVILRTLYSLNNKAVR